MCEHVFYELEVALLHIYLYARVLLKVEWH